MLKIIIVLLAIGLIAVLIQNQMIIGKMNELQNEIQSKEKGNAAEEKKTEFTLDKNVFGDKNISGDKNASFNPFQPVTDRLLLHEEMKGYNGKTATILLLDETNLPPLQEKYPNIYSDAKFGDYVFVYSDLLVVYDFKNDKILKIFNLLNVNITPTA